MTTSPRRRRTPEELVRRAQEAMLRDDFHEAEACGRRALMLNPESLPARHVVAGAVIEQGRFEEAAEMLEEIVAVDPDDLPALADLGSCLYEICEFEDAQSVLSRALEIDPLDAQANYWTALCLERDGQTRRADDHFRRACQRDPEAYPSPFRMRRDDFDSAVAEAMKSLPEPCRDALADVAVATTDLPREADLLEYTPPLDPCVFGLYVGVPIGERSVSESPPLPDVIFLYQRNLERLCRDRETIVQEIRETLIHEIGVYLGCDENELVERGLA